MPPKKRTHVNKTWFFLFELIGLGLSIYLFLVSAGMINIPCPRDSIFACTGIVRGTFGSIGPFSIAALGAIYFLCQLMLTAGLRERSAQLLKGFLVFGGVIFVAWLRALELIYIREICPWCWGVALVTLIHAGIAYTIMMPPLPKLRPGGIIGVVFGGFVVLIGLVSLVELSVGPGKRLQELNQQFAEAAPPPDSDSDVPVATPAPEKPKATPKPTPRPTATPRPTPEQASSAPTPQVEVAPTPTPTPSPTPTPPPTPALAFDPEPQLEPSQDVTILRRRGWRHVPSGESVVKAVKIQPPVLMLAYDPHCSDCHRLIRNTLDRDVMNGLRVTRVAIQEQMLSGQINAMVTELPTLILFGEDGSQLLKHVGSRITAEELARQINQKVQ